MKTPSRTPEEIKKGLECCSIDPYYCGMNCPYAMDCHQIGTVKTLEKDALAYIQQLEAQIPKWISVEERLPENGDVVLVLASGKPRPNVTLYNAYLIASYWTDEGWIADGFEGWEPVDVTHWMDLPDEPWKEDGT